jgi:hypothetical protein
VTRGKSFIRLTPWCNFFTAKDLNQTTARLKSELRQGEKNPPGKNQELTAKAWLLNSPPPSSLPLSQQNHMCPPRINDSNKFEKILTKKFRTFFRRHDTQDNDIGHNDTQQNNTQHKGII